MLISGTDKYEHAPYLLASSAEQLVISMIMAWWGVGFIGYVSNSFIIEIGLGKVSPQIMKFPDHKECSL